MRRLVERGGAGRAVAGGARELGQGEQALGQGLLPLVVDRIARDQGARAREPVGDQLRAALGVARGEQLAERDLGRGELVVKPAVRRRLRDQGGAQRERLLVRLDRSRELVP